MKVQTQAVAKTFLNRYQSGKFTKQQDALAVEEPLEIQIVVGNQTKTLNVTMRTPGQDFELVAGWLFAEGLLKTHSEILEINHTDKDNTILVHLQNQPKLEHFARISTTTSACGVCGSASIDALFARGLEKPQMLLQVSPELLLALPEKLRVAQSVFEITGGLHAAALFNNAGELLALREDIGRHNALDKLVGWAMQQNLLPLQNHVVLVSGRCGYEISQKAIAAGVEILCSVSAPSSLAVRLSDEFGLTLVGFLRGEQMNVYTHANRIVSST